MDDTKGFRVKIKTDDLNEHFTLMAEDFKDACTKVIDDYPAESIKSITEQMVKDFKL